MSNPSEQDERDAEAYANNSGEDGDSDAIRRVKVYFLAGRAGMVPASEVEKFKTDVMLWETQHKRWIAEAVKAERERVIKLLDTHFSQYPTFSGAALESAILNPPSETEGV